ncbi:MAG: class I SAM-dependent methyltransferase [Chloroflexi bacterium]|nr:class I SAM-dependent methyltransferase [Chloroflexota bacterium]
MPALTLPRTDSDGTGPVPSVETPNASMPSRYWERLREPDALVARDLALVRSVPRARPVLDVGCGNGGFVRACLNNGMDAIGVEAFDESARVASQRGVAVLQAAGETLPVTAGSFEFVRLKEVLEHVQRPLVLASEMRRVLRPGGTFLCYVPSQWSQLYPFPANFYDDYTHVRAFSRVGLRRLLEDAGFDRIEVEGYTPPLRAWQRPVGALASRVFPFLWRAVAVNGDVHA